MIPPYFNIEDPQNWRPSSYIHHSLCPSASTKYGLRFVSRKSPREVTARVHGQNVLQWVIALKELAGPQSPQLHRLHAMKQLAVLRKSKRNFSSWYARTIAVAHKRGTETDTAAAGGEVVNNIPTGPPSAQGRLACNGLPNSRKPPPPLGQSYPKLEGEEEDENENAEGENGDAEDENENAEDENAEDENAEDENAEDENAEDENAEDENAEDENKSAENENAEDENAEDENKSAENENAEDENESAENENENKEVGDEGHGESRGKSTNERLSNDRGGGVILWRSNINLEYDGHSPLYAKEPPCQSQSQSGHSGKNTDRRLYNPTSRTSGLSHDPPQTWQDLPTQTRRYIHRSPRRGGPTSPYPDIGWAGPRKHESR